jgi:hypothetical protein
MQAIGGFGRVRSILEKEQGREERRRFRTCGEERRDELKVENGKKQARRKEQGRLTDASSILELLPGKLLVAASFDSCIVIHVVEYHENQRLEETDAQLSAEIIG